MRLLANLFLLLFLADGGLSLVDELLGALAGSDAMSFVRQLAADAVLLLAILLLFLLGIDRRLPKRILLPLIIFALWGALGFWPLSVTIEHSGFFVLASIGQILLALAALAWQSRRSGRCLLSPEMLSGPLFSLRNTLISAAVGLVLLPIVLVFFTLAAASMYLEQQTAGFMRLTPAGIYMTERVYRQGDKTIRLAGMMHVGKEEYYRDLADSFGAGRTIVLVEGVSDNDRLLQNRFDYGGVGEVLGLVSQDAMTFDGRLISFDELDQPVFSGDTEDESSTPHILRADVDINQFAPKTVEFLNVLGRTLFNRSGSGSGLKAYNAWANEHMTPALMQTLMADILDRRNSELVRVLLLTVDKYDTIVIPWGALHMPGIEAAVVDQGFRLDGQQRRLSLDFKTIPYSRLLGRLAAANGERLM